MDKARAYQPLSRSSESLHEARGIMKPRRCPSESEHWLPMTRGADDRIEHELDGINDKALGSNGYPTSPLN